MTETQEQPQLQCQECGTPISQRVSEFSAKKYGKILCMTCQKQQTDSTPVETKPKQSFQEVKVQERATQSIDSRISKEHILNLQGKQFITHAGLLQLAHNEGLKTIETEILQYPSQSADKTCIVRAKVTMKEDKTFTGIGDANGTNVNRNIATHMIRMAETRAVNRALRFATNIGMCSSEELGGESEDQTNNS